MNRILKINNLHSQQKPPLSTENTIHNPISPSIFSGIYDEAREFNAIPEDESNLTKPPCKETVRYYFCYSCGRVHSRIHTCNERYGRCCYLERLKRNYVRLKTLKIFTKRLIHLIVGFPKDSKLPNRDRKRELEKILVKFHRLVRHYYKFRGLRIFDLADDGCYEHFHYAILPEGKQLNATRLRRLLIKASNGYVNALVIKGYRYKNGLLKYFAQRVSGKYGHKKKTFFLEDIMSYAQYREYFYNIRFVTYIGRFPEGLCSNNAQSRLCCPYCKSTDVHLIDILPTDEVFKPPDWLFEHIKIIKTRGLLEFTVAINSL